MSTNRKLAAIMFTDIKDFTRRMNSQEHLGMRLLHTHNEIMDGALRTHGGVLVKNIGDAYLVDFASAVNAVQAAVEAQERFFQCNKGASADEEILVRISIHLGDVVMLDSDMFGDGVNVASRLQSVTPPGGICISREVYAQVRSKVSAEYAALGSFEFKGVAEPVEVYQVLTPLVPAPMESPRPSAPGGATAAPDLSIAVMPFGNWSDEKDNEYFSDGMTEDIITDLAKIGALRVSSRNSVFSFKGKETPARRVAEELKVRYVLEGSVRRAGGRIRISAQLIDSHTDGHLWAERFDRDLSDIFAVQDEIAKAIVGELHVRLTRAQEQALEKRATTSMPAYDLYLKGLFHSRKRTGPDLDAAEKHLEEAVALDPAFAAAHAMLAWVLRFKFAWGIDRRAENMERAQRYTERALAIDGRLPDALLMKGLLLREAGHLDNAIGLLRSLVEQNPSNAQARQYLGNALRDVGYIDEALLHHMRAVELDPKDFIHLHNVCEDQRVNGNFRGLDPFVERLASLAPDHSIVLMYRAFLAARDGDVAAGDRLIDQMARAGHSTFHAHGLRGQYLLARGRLAEAYEDFCRLRELGGNDPIVPSLCLAGLLSLRKLDDAAAVAGAALAGGHTRMSEGHESTTWLHFAMGWINRARGREGAALESFGQARREAEKWAAVFPHGPMLRAAWAVALALTGDGTAAEGEANRIGSEYPSFLVLPYYRAVIRAERKDRAGFLADLRTLRQSGTVGWWGLKNDIAFDAFSADPEFLAVVEPTGFW